MNKTIMKKYYEMQGKVILPEQKDNDNLSLAATVAANFISIGFPLTTEQLRALAKADAEDIKDFYEDNFAMLSEVIGAGKQPKPFYPDFLKDVWKEVMRNTLSTRLFMVYPDCS